jgi:hypothetical protein
MSNNDPLKGIDQVELKVTLGDVQVDDGLRAFRLDPDGRQADRREIFFCERVAGENPAALPLLGRGIIVRIRRSERGSGDSTLKLRGPSGCVDPALWRKRTETFGADAKIEGDWAADHRLVSASLDSKIGADRLDEVVAERPRRLRRLLSGAQEALAADLLVDVDRLELLGPVRARRWTGAGTLDGGVVAELWELDGAQRFLELSTRVDAHPDPAGAKQRFEDAIRARGLTVDAEQGTKTTAVLKHLVAMTRSRR